MDSRPATPEPVEAVNPVEAVEPSTPKRQTELTRDSRLKALTLRDIGWKYQAIASHLQCSIRQVQYACTHRPTPQKHLSGRRAHPRPCDRFVSCLHPKHVKAAKPWRDPTQKDLTTTSLQQFSKSQLTTSNHGCTSPPILPPPKPPLTPPPHSQPTPATPAASTQTSTTSPSSP